MNTVRVTGFAATYNTVIMSASFEPIDLGFPQIVSLNGDIVSLHGFSVLIGYKTGFLFGVNSDAGISSVIGVDGLSPVGARFDIVDKAFDITHWEMAAVNAVATPGTLLSFGLAVSALQLTRRKNCS